MDKIFERFHYMFCLLKCQVLTDDKEFDCQQEADNRFAVAVHGCLQSSKHARTMLVHFPHQFTHVSIMFMKQDLVKKNVNSSQSASTRTELFCQTDFKALSRELEKQEIGHN